jgi:hypothetical protein
MAYQGVKVILVQVELVVKMVAQEPVDQMDHQEQVDHRGLVVSAHQVAQGHQEQVDHQVQADLVV